MRIELREIDDVKAANGVLAGRGDFENIFLTQCGLFEGRHLPEGSRFDFQDLTKIKKWISENMYPVPQYKEAMFSYRLKHIIEENLKTYVTNGEAIKAMIELGYACRYTFNYRGLVSDCCFNACFKKGVTRGYGQIDQKLFKVVGSPNKRLASFQSATRLMGKSDSSGKGCSFEVGRKGYSLGKLDSFEVG